MKLFMFYIGGDCKNSNIELHDVRFCVGETAESCHDDLRRQWWGNPTSLHLDCWGPVDHADGFDLTLTTTPPPEQPEKLFFLNLGGYDPAEFRELHKNVLMVAPDAKAAIARALKEMRGWSLPHRDRIFEVEKVINLNALLLGRNYFLILTPTSTPKRSAFMCKYVRLA
jgi:hypothetical protein